MEIAQEMTSRNLLRGLDVRAVVLVGGRDFGRCPLASYLPTALWPIAGQSVLAHLLDHLAAAGLGRVAVCCAKNDAAAVEAVCREARFEATLVVEELTAGTAGCVREAVACDPGELILVLSAGMLAPPPIERLIEAHQAGGAELTLVFNPNPSGAEMRGSPAEIYVCRPDVLHHIPPGGYSDMKEGLIPSLIRAGGTVCPVVLDRPVGNFHNRAGYLQALETLFPDGQFQGALVPEYSGPGGSKAGQWSGAAVHPTARMCGPVLMSPGVRMGEGAVVIGPAVIGPDVAIGAGSIVVRSALWAGAQVGPRCAVRESILDCAARLPEGTEVVERTISDRLSGARQNGRRLRSEGRDLEAMAPEPGEGAKPSFGRGTLGLLGWVRSQPYLAHALGSVVILTALLWSYGPTVTDLIHEWTVSDEYSSGLLVPFLAFYVLWLRRRDVQAQPVRPALFLGVLALVLAQTVRTIGLLDFFSFAERFSLILSVAAVVLLVLGRQYLRKLATLLLFLCLMLPWPHRVQSLVTLPLQRWSTDSAVFCLELTGREIQQDGNVIHIGDTSVAVAEACNGLRMITAFFVISGLVVLLVKRTWWEKLIVLASSLPIAFLCNTLRLAATAVCFTVIKGPWWEKQFHDWGGYAMMPLAVALVVGELALLARLTTPPLELKPAIISRQHPMHLPDPQ